MTHRDCTTSVELLIRFRVRQHSLHTAHNSCSVSQLPRTFNTSYKLCDTDCIHTTISHNYRKYSTIGATFLQTPDLSNTMSKGHSTSGINYQFQSPRREGPCQTPFGYIWRNSQHTLLFCQTISSLVIIIAPVNCERSDK